MSCPNLCHDCETVAHCEKSGCVPKIDSAPPQVLQPLAPSPAERTESVLIDGIAYTIPAAVAGEMLRLHMEIQAAQPARAGGDAPDWRELAARVMDALADNQEHINAECPEHVKCYPSWEHQARWLRWHAEMFRTGKPVGGGAGVAAVRAALAAAPAAVEREALDDSTLRAAWLAAGGKFHGPNVETATMPETLLLPFLRVIAGPQAHGIGSSKEGAAA